jgi:hypothetical protein
MSEVIDLKIGETADENTIMRTLDWLYGLAINGLPGMGTAEDMAREYLKGDGRLGDKVDALIRWQVAKCATSGFITGLGGIITLPVAIPANLASVLFVQIRMIAAIAYMGGQNIRDDRVKTLVYVCLTGNAAANILKDGGILLGTKLSVSAINKISGKTLTAINQKVGFRLLTKFGQTGVVNLGKWVPVAGGVIGACFDGVYTQMIGSTAKKLFIGTKEPDANVLVIDESKNPGAGQHLLEDWAGSIQHAAGHVAALPGTAVHRLLPSKATDEGPDASTAPE